MMLCNFQNCKSRAGWLQNKQSSYLILGTIYTYDILNSSKPSKTHLSSGKSTSALNSSSPCFVADLHCDKSWKPLRWRLHKLLGLIKVSSGLISTGAALLLFDRFKQLLFRHDSEPKYTTLTLLHKVLNNIICLLYAASFDNCDFELALSDRHWKKLEEMEMELEMENEWVNDREIKIDIIIENSQRQKLRVNG